MSVLSSSCRRGGFGEAGGRVVLSEVLLTNLMRLEATLVANVDAVLTKVSDCCGLFGGSKGSSLGGGWGGSFGGGVGASTDSELIASEV